MILVIIYLILGYWATGETICKNRIYIEYWYGDILMITRFHDISDVSLDTMLNLYLQKNKRDFSTKLII